jgi:hypothetical protein
VNLLRAIFVNEGENMSNTGTKRPKIPENSMAQNGYLCILTNFNRAKFYTTQSYQNVQNCGKLCGKCGKPLKSRGYLMRFLKGAVENFIKCLSRAFLKKV